MKVPPFGITNISYHETHLNWLVGISSDMNDEWMNHINIKQLIFFCWPNSISTGIDPITGQKIWSDFNSLFFIHFFKWACMYNNRNIAKFTGVFSGSLLLVVVVFMDVMWIVDLWRVIWSIGLRLLLHHIFLYFFGAAFCVGFVCGCKCVALNSLSLPLGSNG